MTIEEYMISYLGGALTGVSVYGNIPHPMPDRFVTVELIGSSRSNLINSARLSVRSWDVSRASCAQLHEDVRAAMLAAVSNPEISRCALASGYNSTDLTTNRPRYDATYDVVYLF